MKVLKNTTQKNIMLDSTMYTQAQINDMLYQGYIWFLYNGDDDVWCYEISQNPDNATKDTDYRLSLHSLTKITVEYDKTHDCYVTVAYHIDGTRFYVVL